MFFKILLTKRKRSVFDVLSSSFLSIINFLGILGTFIYVFGNVFIYLLICYRFLFSRALFLGIGNSSKVTFKRITYQMVPLKGRYSFEIYS